MEHITKISIVKASSEAVKLWALTSTQYPFDNRGIQIEAEATIIDVASSFSMNARRAIETLPKELKFPLNAPRWNWQPASDRYLVKDLWDSLNQIIHAQELIVGFEKLPDNVSVFDNGAIVVPYILARTDRKELSYIDPFAMSHAYLYQVMPIFYSENGE